MNRYIIYLIVLSLSWHTALAQVSEPVQVPPSADAEQQQQQPGDDPEKQPEEVDQPVPEPEATVFNPTEEISEDSPVPFPVDI